jgi:hypothetical protein
LHTHIRERERERKSIEDWKKKKRKMKKDQYDFSLVVSTITSFDRIDSSARTYTRHVLPSMNINNRNSNREQNSLDRAYFSRPKSATSFSTSNDTSAFHIVRRPAYRPQVNRQQYNILLEMLRKQAKQVEQQQNALNIQDQGKSY